MTNSLQMPNSALPHRLKNDRLLRALNGDSVDRPPVWMMRQAGRMLPGFRALRTKHSFFERCRTPELASSITVMPVDELEVDAAIVFSDILVVPQAMGLSVEMHERHGPLLPQPIRNVADLGRVHVPDVDDELSYVFDALRLSKQMLGGRVPLIGFAGAPWTLLCYMVEGEGSKSFDVARTFCFQQPEAAHALLRSLTDTTIRYLKSQVSAGADCVQVFDSWAGLLGPADFRVFSQPYLEEIVTALRDTCPVIVFARGAWHALTGLAQSGVQALGLDWCTDPYLARSQCGPHVTLQGNMDPARLLAPISEIKRAVTEMIAAFGRQRYVVNLGHGVLPSTPVDHARAFVEAVKAS